MWYVIQVFTGKEEMIRRLCEVQVDESVLERCFIPKYECSRKQKGKWIVQQKPLFPGYVFMVTDDIGKLHDGLCSIYELTKILTYGHDVIPLKEDEINLLLKLGGEAQVVEMSTGVIVGDKVRVLSGPLMNMEGYIKKIDRHKRKCWLEIDLFGRSQQMVVGLEVISKQ